MIVSLDGGWLTLLSSPCFGPFNFLHIRRSKRNLEKGSLRLTFNIKFLKHEIAKGDIGALIALNSVQVNDYQTVAIVFKNTHFVIVILQEVCKYSA